MATPCGAQSALPLTLMMPVLSTSSVGLVFRKNAYCAPGGLGQTMEMYVSPVVTRVHVCGSANLELAGAMQQRSGMADCASGKTKSVWLLRMRSTGVRTWSAPESGSSGSAGGFWFSCTLHTRARPMSERIGGLGAVTL